MSVTYPNIFKHDIVPLYHEELYSCCQFPVNLFLKCSEIHDHDLQKTKEQLF